MSRTFTVQIQSLDQALEGFKRTLKDLLTGKRVAKRKGLYSTSLEAAGNFLTQGRLALLRAIRKEKPRSIYELAKIVGRNLKNVQTDLQLLEQHGLVTLTESRSRANRRIKVPKVASNDILLKITI
ncbi:MAG TPA: hypothetical protein VJO34_04200 [Methylomirabilota bacterium]|nr:hypothetical protein [Methylomirabilota bacterium]